jgi:hypothetical protein
VITGLIKANVPTRIAFQVSAKVDSRTILDQQGAESLLGMGDMLYLTPGHGLPTRCHGAYVSDAEVHRVVEQLKKQGEAQYIDGILDEPEQQEPCGDRRAAPRARPIRSTTRPCRSCCRTSAPRSRSCQRHLRIGYNRAARLIEDMEKAGLVTPMASNGQPRDHHAVPLGCNAILSPWPSRSCSCPACVSPASTTSSPSTPPPEPPPRASSSRSSTARQGGREGLGTFAFARPGKFRWTYDKPHKQVLVGDGSKLWIHDPT